MDHAMALVEAYLRVNGYSTVSEYPVVVPAAAGGNRTATGAGILAVRFPVAGSMSPQDAGREAKGIRTPVGVKLFGPDLAELEGLGHVDGAVRNHNAGRLIL